MTVTYPEGVKSLGNQKVVVLTTEPADVTAITTVEIAAGVETTMYGIGRFNPGGTQNKGNSPRRTGEGSQLERLGLASYTSPSLAYVWDPQGAPNSTVNAAKAALPAGAERWIVERLGKDSETAFANGDRYRVHHVELGEQFPVATGDDEFALEQITQETGYLTRPQDGVVGGESSSSSSSS